jgi:hypothetical protein
LFCCLLLVSLRSLLKLWRVEIRPVLFSFWSLAADIFAFLLISYLIIFKHFSLRWNTAGFIIPTRLNFCLNYIAIFVFESGALTALILRIFVLDEILQLSQLLNVFIENLLNLCNVFLYQHKLHPFLLSLLIWKNLLDLSGIKLVSYLSHQFVHSFLRLYAFRCLSLYHFFQCNCLSFVIYFSF